MTAHREIYRRLSAFDVKAFYWMAGSFAAGIALMFVVITFVPQQWLDDYVHASEPSFSFMEPTAGARYVLIPLAITGVLIIFSLVVGIIAAAESRTFLGSGATRQAIWLDARRTNVGFAAFLIVTVAAATMVAVLLDGDIGRIDVRGLLTATATIFLSLLVAFEVGYVVSLLFTRYRWLPALIACLTYVGLLLFALSSWSEGTESEYWTWFRVFMLAALTAVALVGSHRMMTSLPMRRST